MQFEGIWPSGSSEVPKWSWVQLLLVVRQAMWTKIEDILAKPPATCHTLRLDSDDPCPAVVQASSFLLE